jgi:invasion protein IalB
MISSMDQWNTLCGMARRGLLTALAVALGASLAIAQQAPAVPKTPAAPKAAAPAPAPAAPAPAGATAGATPVGAAPDESAWVKLCLKNDQTGNKEICLVNHEGLEPNTGMVLVSAAVRTVEGEDKQSLLVRLPTAYSLVIPAGVQIKIDEGEPISLQYAVCFPTSCQVQIELTKEMFDNMRKGKQMVVAAMNMQQKTMAFPVPLTGFGKVFDGPPVDNAKYEESRRQLMEKFRQRQAELANKAAEAQQKKEQGGGEAQSSGAPPQPGAPNATVAPSKTPPVPAH